MKTNLFSDFSPVAKADWLAKVERDLKGRSLEELTLQLDESLTISPFAHADDFDEMPARLSQKAGWEIGEDFVVGDNKKANKQVLNALNWGANAPRFIIEKRVNARSLQTILKEVELNYISTHFLLNTTDISPLSLLKSFAKIAEQKGANNHELKGTLNVENGQYEAQDKLVRYAQKYLPNFRVLTVSTNRFSSAENSVVKELEETIKAAEQFFLNSKLKAENIAAQIQFSVTIGTNYLIEIAKLRALKLLWFNVLGAYGVKNKGIELDVHFAENTYSEDPNTNRIKATSMAMSAVIGGANRVTVLPSKSTTKKEAEFSKRIARNVQHILQLESYLDKVADPAAGSYYIEKLTQQICEKVWAKL